MYGAILIGYVRAGDGPKKPPGLTFWIFNGPILLFLFIVGLGGGNGGSSSSSQHTEVLQVSGMHRAAQRSMGGWNWILPPPRTATQR